jgi:Predicted hydrolases or acyltransferases (alpha/beta hydrolase superfamily)
MTKATRPRSSPVAGEAPRTRRRSRRRHVAAAFIALTALATGCGAGDTPTAVGPPASLGGKPETIDGRFDVGNGRMLALRCWGEGAPTVIYDAGTGTSGIAQAAPSRAVRELAGTTRVCSYDRAGVGASDAAPARVRSLDDVVADLDALLAVARVAPPYVMVGSSGGGFDVYHHAGRHPDDVVGLVLLDVPAGQPDIPPSEVPAWDGAENPEHLDYVAAERQMALYRLPIPPIPVTVVTASRGQSADPAEQRIWLEGSSRPVQTVIDGGHNIFSDNPTATVAAVLDVLGAARAGGRPS